MIQLLIPKIGLPIHDLYPNPGIEHERNDKDFYQVILGFWGGGIVGGTQEAERAALWILLMEASTTRQMTVKA